MNQAALHKPRHGRARREIEQTSAGPNQGPILQPLRRERVWAAAAHLSALFLFVGLPLTNILLPWLIRRWWHHRSVFIDHHGTEALNFQISITLYAIALALLSYFVAAGLVLLTALGMFDVIYVGIAADRAHSGKKYHYPMAIRFVS